uniref:Uncharacterized protein n=1 Tax=Laticauda laticaudata TaxID=8630 RepID=A0A8C5RPU7_LATLA
MNLHIYSTYKSAKCCFSFCFIFYTNCLLSSVFFSPDTDEYRPPVWKSYCEYLIRYYHCLPHS